MRTLLTPRAAALLLGVHARTIQRWARAGRIVVVRLPSGRLRIERSEIDRLLGRSRPNGEHSPSEPPG
jgi:putative resolvase